ncbi:hypothetical protein Ocin01_20181, partial [Orchesella cincta]
TISESPQFPILSNIFNYPATLVKYQLTTKDWRTFYCLILDQVTDRILIFGTMKKSSSIWNIPLNGMRRAPFKVAPLLFDQLYTIHVSRFGKVIPTVYALLPNRYESTYVKMLNALKDLAPNLNPRSITTDFERAAKNAFKVVFPVCTQHGCLFHLGQCFWRRIQTLPEKVRKALAELISDPFYSSSTDIEDLVDYVEDNWVGGNRRGRERPPRFAIEEWNCHSRVIEDLSRTNNIVEGWHRGFQSQLGAAHPTIWKFIEAIKKQQSLNELQMEQQLAGESPQPQRGRYQDLTIRLKAVVEDFENRPISDYLTGIAHNLNLSV